MLGEGCVIFWVMGYGMNNYILRSYRDVIVITKCTIRRASKA